MDVDQAVLLGRMMLQEVLILAGPVLIIAIVVSLLVNVLQVLTSLQDSTVSTLSRLVVTGAALFFMMPWMWRNLAHYTLGIFSNFNRYLQ
jgi:flagellar biosynthetic protein FliQ